MKKFVIGVFCCVGLLITTTENVVQIAENAKPEITSINKFV